MTPEKFDELKTIHLSSLKEYIAMLSVASGSLKTGLSGKQLAEEIIKGALFLKTFIETGEVPSPSSDQ
jgi:hypothetical protein